MSRPTRRACLSAAATLVAGLAVAGGPFVPAAQAQSSRAQPYLMTTQEAVRLKQAAAYLNTVQSMRARFAQTSSRGNYVEGTVYMRRPGRLRIEYDPPAQILVVANGSYVIYEDGELEQVNYIGLGDTPLGILLREEVEFTDPDITVTGMRHGGGLLEIDLVETEDPGQGVLTLVFADSPMELRQWRVRDAQNIEVTVTLFAPRFGVDLDSDLFKYQEKAGFQRQ
ncbi:outer membrane lipoprotein carrier protein LolA [Roseospira marina]|uniref:Outer membrane lipoprotein carrier protein LolA n=1 Tax=Roseospira marina TaxID=140057 RepID=A0A5M6IE59_9PROT|nr:outer membrane lipoprotein carrier protein LolA [Roseospira marina]KAA5606533.1 outer membrane lipoprotein carrier protein LolA [Roseospira marina]MBB4314039.1 outer membrane lipoprotein-sorting protein [Roseospira marina]MBB5087200.1 outer membrane lipoprotein-sorting protein [Roseospira marina]